MGSGEPQEMCPDCAGVVIDGWACGACGWYPPADDDDLNRELLELAHGESNRRGELAARPDAMDPRRGAPAG